MSFGGNGGGSGSIADSSDVTLSNPNDKDVLTYDSSTGKWVNLSGTQIPTVVHNDDYTLQLTDAGTVVEMGSSNALTLTVPANSSVAFPVNTVIELAQTGSGQLTITGEAGVTLRTAASLTARTQFSVIGLRKRSTDVWIVSGDLT